MSDAGTNAWATVDPLPTLLLDSDPEAAAMMSSQLRHAGFETYIAANGPSAVLAARRTPFGAIVVVADLGNAAMCDTLRALRQAAPNSWLVLIADPTIDRAEEFLHELDGDALFAAPFRVADLTQRLHTLSDRKRPAS